MRAYSLMYHDVIDPGAADASGFSGGDAALYKLEAKSFEKHLTALSRAIDAAGVERIADPQALYRRAASRPPVVVLHFDDGGKSALRAADMIERHGFRGFFHITTDRIGTPGFVSEPDLRELHERGHVIGSHSCSHPPRMSRLSFGELLREWSDSRSRLADILGAPVNVASVPGGYSSPEVISAAERAGIELLFNSEPVSRFAWFRRCLILGRYAVKRAMPAEEVAAMAVGARGPRFRQWASWNAKKVLKRVGGSSWLTLRKRILDR